MYVEASVHSGVQTLWAIDQTIPRRPPRMFRKADLRCIPGITRTILVGSTEVTRFWD